MVPIQKGEPVLDVLMVAVAAAFFAACLAYMVGCERLGQNDGSH